MLNEDYKDMLSCFLSEGAEFVVIGAYAMAAQGFPRATQDIAIWVFPSVENARRVMKALEKFGAPLAAVSQKDFEHDDTVLQIGVAPRRIDVSTGISGVTVEEARKAVVNVEIDGLLVNLLPLSLLIQNKLATGRKRDLDDVEQLQALLKKSPS